MKRSVAIQHIINVLRLTGNHFCDDERDKVDADRILTRLENIGMLPPLRTHTYTDEFWDRAICEEMDGMDVKTATWDSEDSDNDEL